MSEPLPIALRRLAQLARRTGFRAVLLVGLALSSGIAEAQSTAPAQVAAPGPIEVPQFDADLPKASDEGHVTLHWAESKLEPGDFYQLEQADNAEFAGARRVLVRLDHISFISGLENGTHYFRVRVKPAQGEPGAWSAPHAIEVKHHSLAFSLTLFAIGALVFGITVAFIATQGFRKEEEARA